MKKIISVSLVVYAILLIPLFIWMRFTFAFKSDDLWLQITREDGVSYSVMDELSDKVPIDYFEFAIYKDFADQVLYEDTTLNTTVRVWKQFYFDHRVPSGTEHTITPDWTAPPFGQNPNGIFVYPYTANADDSTLAEITLHEITLTPKSVYEVGRIAFMGDTQIDFYARAAQAGFISYDESLIFLPDDLMLTYYNMKNNAEISSIEDLSYDALLIKVTAPHIPTQKELREFIATLEDEGYDVYRPIQQDEIVWRNNRIFYFVTVTVIMSAVVVFLVIRRRRRQV